MTVPMYANASDHVQLNATICDFDVATVADTTTEIRKESAATAVLAKLIQQDFVVRRQSRVGAANFRKFFLVVSDSRQE